jgi:hypothetical protein
VFIQDAHGKRVCQRRGTGGHVSVGVWEEERGVEYGYDDACPPRGLAGFAGPDRAWTGRERRPMMENASA